MAKQPEFTKYLPLEVWFRQRPKTVTEIKLKFDEVDAILGASLPASATQLSTWWTNLRPKVQSYRTAWLNPGWRVIAFDQKARWARFARVG